METVKELKYKIKVKNVGDSDDNAWTETIIEEVELNVTIDQHATTMIANFNRTCRENESHREILDVFEISETQTTVKEILRHDWTKTSLVTEKGGFDKMKCTVCGVTGKRHGVGPSVAIDYRFRKHEFECQGSENGL